MMLGGMSINTAVGLAKIGKVPVGLIACFGNDNSGKFLVSGLQEYDIDISNLLFTDEAGTGTAICFIHPDSERSMILCLAANHHLTKDKIDYSVFQSGDIAHFGGSMICEGTRGDDLAVIFKKLKEIGVTISMDTCWDGTDQWSKILNPCLPYCDIFETNKEEGLRYSGKDTVEEAIEHFSFFGPKIVVLKEGSEGVRIKSDEYSGSVPIFQVKAVDATGAGDSFNAGFLFGLYYGWPIEQATIFASAVGAICVTAYGASTGILSYDETIDFIRSQSRLGNWNWKILP